MIVFASVTLFGYLSRAGYDSSLLIILNLYFGFPGLLSSHIHLSFIYALIQMFLIVAEPDRAYCTSTP